MNFTELLKSLGISDEQIQLIVKAMKANKLFVTNEEKIEERYAKMKRQRDTSRKELEDKTAGLKKLYQELFLS